MNTYAEIKNRHQAEVNAFPMAAAFNEKQFEEGMKQLGLHPTETDKVCSVGGGCFIRKSDAGRFHEMFERHHEEISRRIAEDKKGDGFIYDMFCEELANHEYGYTHDAEPALNALGMTYRSLTENAALANGFLWACRDLTACED